MFQITNQQIENRWNILPIRLIEILCSFDIGKTIKEISKINHLTDEKSDKIAGLIGFVVMGFIHLEDLAKEIKEATGIHSEIVDLIVKEIDRKIFALIRSEIDKAYALPLTSEAEIEEAEGGEITEPVVTDIRRETDGVKIIKEVRYAQPAEVEPMRIVGVGEEEKLVIPKAEEKSFKIEEPVSAPEPVSATTMPEGPVVLHEEEELKSVLGETKKKSLGELFGFLNGKESAVKKESASVIGEVGYDSLEVDKLRSEKEPEERVVHYDVGLMTPLEQDKDEKVVMGDEEQKDNKIEAPEKTESKPRLFFKNIIQAIRPTIKVVDFTEVEEEKKDISEPKEFLATIDSSKENLKEESLITETEAPKMIAEEVKQEETPAAEIKKEIKEGFFKKLFGFGKNKKIANQEIVVEADKIKNLEENESLKEEDLKEEQFKNETQPQAQTQTEIFIESPKEEIKMKPQRFLSKLTGFFKKKAKIEIETEKEIAAESEIEKKESLNPPADGGKPLMIETEDESAKVSEIQSLKEKEEESPIEKKKGFLSFLFGKKKSLKVSESQSSKEEENPENLGVDKLEEIKMEPKTEPLKILSEILIEEKMEEISPKESFFKKLFKFKKKNKDNKDKEDESLNVPEFKSLKDNDDKVPESGSLKV
ncbi:MAG: hypothetical protein AAB504_03500 [Patescibacteria group bacterium]